MPYLLMCKCYDYDDQFYTEQDGGYPELVFEDEQYLEALSELEARHEHEWPSCTPLDSYYQDHTLSDLSSSGLDDEALAQSISVVLNETLSPRDLLEQDFQTKKLTDEQQRLIGLMLDLAGYSYLEFVHHYRGD